MLKHFFLIFSYLVLSSVCHGQAEQNPFIRMGLMARSVTLSKTQTVAPPGNGVLEYIPEFPLFTKIRLSLSLNGFAESPAERTALADKLATEKIPEIMKALDRQGLLAEAVRLARVYNLDVLHILGPIIGENTFNGMIDRTLMDSYAKMFQKSDFETMSGRMRALTASTEIQDCLRAPISNYWKWRCVLYYSPTRNSSNGDLIRGFYSITTSGSFGIGQIQPYLVWSLNDVVAQLNQQYLRFEIYDMEKAFKIIFNNKEMLAYIAANAVTAIEVYKLVSGVDISENPGLTTTLYNVGDEYQRAYSLKQRRMRDPSAMPENNYLGWYLNRNEKLIRSFLKKY